MTSFIVLEVKSVELGVASCVTMRTTRLWASLGVRERVIII